MGSITKDMEALKSQMAEVEADKAKLAEVAEETKEKLTAMSAELEAKTLELDQAKEGHDAAVAEKDEAILAKDAEIEALVKERDELKAKLELMPGEAHVEGREPVAEAGEAGEERDWIAEANAKEGADKIAFYRENKKEIDAAYRKLRK